MSAYEIIGEQNTQIENALHAAIDACETYLEALDGILAEDSTQSNAALVKRMKQYQKKIGKINALIEDEALQELNFCLDRHFAVKLTEENKFI